MPKKKRKKKNIAGRCGKRADRCVKSVIAAFVHKHRAVATAAAVLLLLAVFTTALYFGVSPAKTMRYEYSSVYFGSYPQTRITSPALLDALNAFAAEWKPFDDCYTGKNYYGTMYRAESMHFADVQYGGELYRAVRIDDYRPETILDCPCAEHSLQDENGYAPGIVFWFRWEPIRWYVTDKNKNLLLTEKVLDAASFADAFYLIDRDGDGDVDPETEFSAKQYLMLPANLYRTASIRRWLNNCFYNAAFTKNERRAIRPVLHRADESAANAKYGLHSLTMDRVWLFSAAETLAWEESNASEDALFPDATDYAKCRGAFSADYKGHACTWWWTRSPGDFSGDVISIVENEMVITFDRQFPQAYALGGVRCAIRLAAASAATEG